MRRPLGRWSLLAVAVAVTAGACYAALTLERRSVDLRRAFNAAESHGTALHASLAEARRALAAMASPGQAAEGWSRRAKSAIESSSVTLTALAAAIPGTSFDASRDVLGKLVEAEDRIRGYAVGSRPLMASDVTFGEALPLLDDLDGQVTQAIRQLAGATNQRVSALRDTQAAALAGALTALLLGALILTPLPRTAVAASDDLAMAPADAPAEELASMATIHTAPMPSSLAAPPRLDVEALAAVCGELSAMVDGSQLSVALARVAQALGASGVIVWLANAAGTSLDVVAFHGYDARLIERLGATRADDDNPTSSAFSSAAVVVAAPRAGQPAAMAVPIAGPKGVVGVLSAELTTTSAAALTETTAAARIVAAQLAALLGVPAPIEPGVSGNAQAQR